MPTYCYKCSDCGYTKEEYRSMSKRDSPIQCPECKTRMDRLIGTGSGFKITGGGVFKQGWSLSKEEK